MLKRQEKPASFYRNLPVFGSSEVVGFGKMRTTKRYLDNWQSIVSGNILSYDKRNSSLSKLGISFLFDKLNSATAAFKALPKGWLAVAILLF